MKPSRRTSLPSPASPPAALAPPGAVRREADRRVADAHARRRRARSAPPSTSRSPATARLPHARRSSTRRCATRVQDLGFTLDVADPGPATGAHARSRSDRAREQVERARRCATDTGTWVVSARLEPAGGDTFLLRIVVVPPSGKQLRVRVESVSATDVSVRGLVLLRDLLARTRERAAAARPARARRSRRAPA